MKDCIYFSQYSGLAYVSEYARDMMTMPRIHALTQAVDRLNEAKIRGDEGSAEVATWEIAWILDPQVTEKHFVG